MPPHRVYVEAFVGGGAVLRHKRPAQREIAVDRSLDCLARLSHHVSARVFLVCADAIEFLQSYEFAGDELVYCDPPYLPELRRQKRVYRHDMTSRDHIELIATLTALPCRVMISGYPSDIYDSLLALWNREQFKARTNREWVTEAVWFNYAKPTLLHDGRFDADDARRRHTLRKRLARLHRRVVKMSVAERSELAVLMQDQLAEVKQWRKL
jgi:DNA adenine methylase